MDIFDYTEYDLYILYKERKCKEKDVENYN